MRAASFGFGSRFRVYMGPSVLKSSLWVSGCAVVTYLLSFVSQVVIARYFGASGELDAYLTAYAIPGSTLGIVLTGIGFVVVPMWVKQREENDELKALSGSLILVMVAVALTVAVLGAVLADSVVALTAPGLDSEKLLLASRLQVFFWFAAGFWVISNLFVAIEHARNSFFVPALGMIMRPILVILGALILAGQWGIFSLAVGHLVAYFLLSAVLAFKVLRSLEVSFSASALRRTMREFFPSSFSCGGVAATFRCAACHRRVLVIEAAGSQPLLSGVRHQDRCGSLFDKRLRDGRRQLPVNGGGCGSRRYGSSSPADYKDAQVHPGVNDSSGLLVGRAQDPLFDCGFPTGKIRRAGDAGSGCRFALVPVWSARARLHVYLVQGDFCACWPQGFCCYFIDLSWGLFHWIRYPVRHLLLHWHWDFLCYLLDHVLHGFRRLFGATGRNAAGTRGCHLLAQGRECLPGCCLRCEGHLYSSRSRSEHLAQGLIYGGGLRCSVYLDVLYCA